MATACIGKSIKIKGTITALEPLVVAGRVEGAINVNNHMLSITQDGHVEADAIADTITIEGKAKGKLQANVRMTLGQTATVIGEIVAPALSVAEGATVQGRIDTTRRDPAAKTSSPKADSPTA